jgi:putative DNA primase/helicase
MVGMSPLFLTGKHGPCPLCGGKDRWRYIDRDGSGDWVCNQCGHGAGTDLVMRFLKVEFKGAAERIESVIGKSVVALKAPKQSAVSQIAEMKKLWDGGQSITPGSPPDLFLRKRAIALAQYPPCLRQTRGMMLAKVVSPEGRAVNVHRTLLTDAGDKRPNADGKCRFLMAGEFPAGSAVRLAPHGEALGIAEGIETALAASILFDMPVWALLVAQNLSKFKAPEGVTQVTIFADHDANYTGHAVAFACANRLAIAKLSVRVRMPAEPSDWNDVLMRQHNQDRAASAAPRPEANGRLPQGRFINASGQPT